MVECYRIGCPNHAIEALGRSDITSFDCWLCYYLCSLQGSLLFVFEHVVAWVKVLDSFVQVKLPRGAYFIAFMCTESWSTLLFLFCIYPGLSCFSWRNSVLWFGCWENVSEGHLEEARDTHLIVEAHRKAVDIVLILLLVGFSLLVCSNRWKLGRMSAALPRATTVIGTRLDIIMFLCRAFSGFQQFFRLIGRAHGEAVDICHAFVSPWGPSDKCLQLRQEL